MKKRVMIVSNTLAEGGAERWASFMLNELDPELFEITLILFRDKVDYPCPEAVHVCCLHHRRTTDSVRTVRRLRAMLYEQQPEVVVSNGNYTSQFVGQAIRKLPARWVARFSGNIGQSRQTIAQKLGWFWLDRNIHLAATLVANSEGVLGDVRRRWTDLSAKSVLVRNGVDVQGLRSKGEAHQRERGLVVAVGRLVGQKRPDIFVDAIDRLRRLLEQLDTPMGIRAVWCGEGPLRERTQQQIDALGLTDVINLVGFRDDVTGWLARASCFVLTSDHEGSPNVLVEAMAMGTPAVSTDCLHGPAELIGDDRGWLAPVGDANAIAKSIGEALVHVDVAREKSARSRAWVESQVASSKVVEDWSSILFPNPMNATSTTVQSSSFREVG
ncbi:MAG: glycosyltransferase [Planctomycetota bacterium]